MVSSPPLQNAFDFYSPGGWWAFLSKKPGALSWGGIEILCLGPHDSTAVVAACADMFASCRVQDNKLAFDCIHVIFPPAHDSAHHLYEIIVPEDAESTASEVQSLRERVKQRITVYVSSDLDGRRLTDEVLSFGARSVALVVEADIYETGIPTRRPQGGDSTQLETKRDLPEGSGFRVEDWPWSDRIARLAEGITGKIGDKQTMVLLLSKQYAPIHRESVERILGVEGAGVATLQSPSYIQLIREREKEWSEKLRQGSTESILAEIDELKLDKDIRAQLRAQVLFSGDAPGAGFEEIKPHIKTLEAEAPPNLIVKFAIMAYHAARQDEALRLLRVALTKRPDEEVTFKMAIALARHLSAEMELQELCAQVVRLFPFSDTALHEAFRACSAPSDYETFIETTNSTFCERPVTDKCLLLLRLAKAFAEDDAYDLGSLIDEMSRKHPQFVDLAVIMMAHYEINRGRPLNAVDICLGYEWKAETKEERSAIRLLLDATEGALLRLSEQEMSQDRLDHLSACVRRVATYLHTHPTDNWLRLRFAEVVSPHVTGAYGYLILGHLAVRGKRPEPRCLYEHPSSAEPIPNEDYLAFFQGVLEEAQRQEILLLGHGILPDTANYDERRLLDHTWRMILALDVAGADDSHCDVLIRLLHTGLLLAGRVGRPGEATELVGRVAISLSLSGYGQMARDLAEHILVMVSEDEGELVAAWLEYAEVYLRIHRPHEAIVWLNVALSRADHPWSPAAVYQASFLAARILRDLSMYDLALDAVRWTKDIVKQVGLHDSAAGRIDYIESAIEVGLFQHQGVSTPEGQARLRTLGERLIVRLAEAREKEDELLPVATLLASIVTIMSTAGLDTERLIEEIKTTAESLYGHAKTFLLASSAEFMGRIGFSDSVRR